jgi:D-hydroxyproline dehydrogenase subunit gamma
MRKASSTLRESVTVWLNGAPVLLPVGAMVSAVFLNTNTPCRTSISGEPRAALCGMGICFECRAVVDGLPHQRTCQLVCRDGMRVETQS